MADVDVRRAAERFHTELGWLDSWHSFSFSGHYDPANTHHGLLLVSNDDTVAAGAGFPTHAHRDMEIVTWVLSGELEHTDTTGAHDVIRPGMAQRMSAGTGVRHSEMNASATLPVHFVQMWVMPDTEGVPPSYEQVDVSDQLERGELVAVASGVTGRAAVTIHQERATLWAARLPTGRVVEIPAAEHAHLFVARGSAGLGEAGDLVQGDAVRLTEAGALPLESRSDDTEILLWQMG